MIQQIRYVTRNIVSTMLFLDKIKDVINIVYKNVVTRLITKIDTLDTFINNIILGLFQRTNLFRKL